MSQAQPSPDISVCCEIASFVSSLDKRLHNARWVHRDRQEQLPRLREQLLGQRKCIATKVLLWL